MTLDMNNMNIFIGKFLINTSNSNYLRFFKFSAKIDAFSNSFKQKQISEKLMIFQFGKNNVYFFSQK